MPGDPQTLRQATADRQVRVLSLIQPTGEVHLGSYLGALRGWAADQHVQEAFHGVADLHALTVEHDPAVLGARTLELATVLLAVGIDPDTSTLFVQSHVHEHSQLAWLMECTVSFGELRRMTQFKDRSDGAESVRAGLFTYPALMAADILVYDADQVPVGDDQRQHVELARDLAIRFNHHYGDTFVVPEATVPTVGARVMDLAHPTRKMSKSAGSPQGRIGVLDDPRYIEHKLRRAVTDNESEVRYDPAAKPGVSNLLELLGALTDRSPAEAAAGYTRYGDLKADVAAAVIEALAPVRQRYAELAADPAGVSAILAKGAAKASEVASATLARATRAIGLLPADAG
ncbi:MAG: tryptophan--tRNA ligase [Acidimicrobiales bacterium]